MAFVTRKTQSYDRGTHGSLTTALHSSRTEMVFRTNLRGHLRRLHQVPQHTVGPAVGEATNVRVGQGGDLLIDLFCGHGLLWRVDSTTPRASAGARRSILRSVSTCREARLISF